MWRAGCCEAGCRVVGVDNLNAYYDPALKEARLARLAGPPRLSLRQARPGRSRRHGGAVRRGALPLVVHLAAQAGVRYSLRDPHAYVDANLRASSTCWRAAGTTAAGIWSMPRQLGLRRQHPLPFSAPRQCRSSDQPLRRDQEGQRADGACLCHLYGLPATGLRFFTVYGPWGRPDMAMWLFTEAILRGQPIKLFNQRQHAPRLHLHRRHRGVAWSGSIDRPRGADPAWSGDEPDPAAAGALAHLQHRQQPAGRSARTWSICWSRLSAARRQGTVADAAGRRPRDLCRRRRSDARRRLSPGDADRRWRRRASSRGIGPIISFRRDCPRILRNLNQRCARLGAAHAAARGAQAHHRLFRRSAEHPVAARPTDDSGRLGLPVRQLPILMLASLIMLLNFAISAF